MECPSCRMIYVDRGRLREKDTKTRQQRRVVLDAETIDVLAEHRRRAEERAALLGETLGSDGYVFTNDPLSRSPRRPDGVSQRYDRLAKGLKITTTLKDLRHYNATELINSGVDVRTVAGRLGHGGGGSTTLRVYTAWLSAADQRAARSVSGRMPPPPTPDSLPMQRWEPRTTVARTRRSPLIFAEPSPWES